MNEKNNKKDTNIFLWLIVIIIVGAIISSIFGGVCSDGWSSPSIGSIGACSHHGGVRNTSWIFFLIVIVGIIFLCFCFKSGEKDENKTNNDTNNGYIETMSVPPIVDEDKKINTNKKIITKQSVQVKLSQAIINQQTVTFSYTDNVGKKSKRVLTPKQIKIKWGTLCVTGFDHIRKAPRTFAIKRIKNLHIFHENTKKPEVSISYKKY